MIAIDKFRMQNLMVPIPDELVEQLKEIVEALEELLQLSKS